MKAPQLWLTLTQQSSANAKGPEALSSLAIGVFFLIGGAAALRATPGPDVSFLLYAAGRVIDGARYGADIMEINPPLIVWLYMLPVLAARVIGASPYTMLTVFTLLLAGAALFAMSRALDLGRERTLILTALAAALVVVPALDFGQKEHVAGALCVPWVAIAIVRADGRQPRGWLLAFASIAGSLGFLLKPYFLLAWLAIEAVLVLRRGPRIVLRTENVCFAIGGLAYVTATALLAPDFIDLAMRLGPAYGNYLAQGRLEAGMAWIGAAIFVWYRLRHPSHSVAAAVLEAGTIGFILSAVCQLKWWTYHFLPATIFALPALALVPLPELRRWRAPDGVVAVLMKSVVVYMLVAAVLENIDVLTHPENPENLSEPYMFEMLQSIAEHAPAGPVMILSTNIHSAFPVVPLSGAIWASRLPHLWPLMTSYEGQWRSGGTIHFRPAEERGGIEKWLNEVILEDLRVFRPRMIFVMAHNPEINDSGGARRIDYLAYLRDDPRLDEALSNYRPLPDVGRYDVLERIQ